MEQAAQCIYPSDDAEVSQLPERKRKNYHTQTSFSQDLIDSPIYNEEMMENVMVGIAQNIWVEMDRQRMTIRGLADLSSVNYSMLSRLFNNKVHIGLTSLIKVAAALHVSPSELFPYDQNKRKTNGQRFDEITKGMDLASINYLLDVCAGYSKIYHNRHFK